MQKKLYHIKYSGYGYHGGGRKPTGIKRISFSVSGTPEKVEALKQKAKESEMTISAFVFQQCGVN